MKADQIGSSLNSSPTLWWHWTKELVDLKALSRDVAVTLVPLHMASRLSSLAVTLELLWLLDTNILVCSYV